MRTGAELIAAERERQVTAEGYDAERDAGHEGELANAGWCYRWGDGSERPPQGWPWASRFWKPKDRTRNLVRSGALYLAAAAATSDDFDRDLYRKVADDIAVEIDQLLAGSTR